MDKQTYLRLSPWFDPIEPAPRELYVERTDSAWSALEESRLAPNPRAALLVGPQATGKSTELLYLARRLAEEADPPLIGVLPLWRQYDTTELDAAKVLFLVAVAVLRLAEAKPSTDVVRELVDAYDELVALDRSGPRLDIAKLLTNLALLTSAAIDGGASMLFSLLGATGEALSGADKLSLPGRSQALEANDPRMVRMANALESCVKWARGQLGGVPIAMFVDGLDKLADPDSTDPYFGSAALARPRCAGFQVIYAAPLSTYRGLEERKLEDEFDFLPVGNFRIFRDRAPHDATGPGFARMREIVERRLNAAKLPAETVIEGGLDSPALAAAIRASGGIPRFLIKMLDRALRGAVLHPAAHTPAATAVHIDDAIHREAQSLVRRLEGHPEALPILREVLETCQPPREHASFLIRENLVLMYQNRFDWYRPSPLLDEYLGAKGLGSESM